MRYSQKYYFPEKHVMKFIINGMKDSQKIATL